MTPRVLIVGAGPAGLRAAGVVCLTVVNLGRKNRRHVCFPGIIGSDPVEGTIGMFDAELRANRGLSVAVIVALLTPPPRLGR